MYEAPRSSWAEWEYLVHRVAHRRFAADKSRAQMQANAVAASFR